MLGQIKDDLREQKMMQNHQDQNDLNQAFDFINMDDGFDAEKDKPNFGSSAQTTKKQATTEERDKSPAADREKFKAPVIKKNAQMTKGKIQVADEDNSKQIADNEDDLDKDFDSQPRERTFTFSKALGMEGGEGTDSPQNNSENDNDIDARKEKLKQQLMSLQEIE